jgi:hypothetical protein
VSDRPSTAEGPTPDPPEELPPGPSGWRDWWAANGRLVGAACGSAGLAGGGLFSSLHWGIPPTACIALIAVGVMQAINSLLRRKLDHWGIEDVGRSLWAELVLGCLFPLAFGTTDLLVALPRTLEVVLTSMLGAGCLVVTFVEFGIAKAVAADPKRISVTRYIARCTWFSEVLKTDRRSIEEALKQIEDLRLLPPLGWLFQPIRGTLLSGARYMMIIGIFVPSVALATPWGRSEPPRPSEVGGEAKQSAQSEVSKAKPGAKQGKPTGTSSATVPGKEAPAQCGATPGEGVPDSLQWMRDDFAMLFLGAPAGSERKLGTTPPTGGDGVCRVEASGPHRFAYAAQWDLTTGQLKSIAVDSLTWGPALFIAPAAQRVQQLIARYGALGGSPRRYAGQGDYYLVRVLRGTIVLIRTQFTEPSGWAKPFTVLPLAVSAAWRDQVRAHERWLWPVVELHHDGTRTYKLVEHAVDRDSAITIDYDPATEHAHSTVGEVLRSYGPDGAWLDDTEFQALAARAG